MGQAEATTPSNDPAKGVALKIISAWVVLPLFFLVTGGAFAWWEAWVYCVILLVPMTVFVSRVAKTDPEFIARRSKMREKERSQRKILALGYPAMLGELLIPGLDYRYGWSEPPTSVVVVAMVLVLAGYLTVLRVFRENRWAGRTVEVFADQSVISTGPYALVRHPMYSGTLLMYLATPIALGSWWAAIPALAFIPIFVFRIRNEEQVLVRQLPGYDEYRQTVRYRLVPFVW